MADVHVQGGRRNGWSWVKREEVALTSADLETVGAVKDLGSDWSTV